jgi:predicted acylesterase/phospholipase RssA
VSGGAINAIILASYKSGEE